MIEETRAAQDESPSKPMNNEPANEQPERISRWEKPPTGEGAGREPSRSGIPAVVQGDNGTRAKGEEGTAGERSALGLRDNDIRSLLCPLRRRHS